MAVKKHCLSVSWNCPNWIGLEMSGEAGYSRGLQLRQRRGCAGLRVHGCLWQVSGSKIKSGCVVLGATVEGAS